MVLSRFQYLRKSGNIFLHYCSILLLVMPALAASAEHSTTVVKADEKSGHLVRSVAVQPHTVTSAAVDRSATSPAAEPTTGNASDLIAMIDSIAAEQGVEESLVHSVIRAESNYNPLAISAKGAIGMMQLIPATARRFGVDHALDPRENVLGGVKYLKFLLDYYHDDYVRAIAAYNAGEAAVDKYRGVPPYAETRNYVYTVAKNLKTQRAERAARKPVEPATPVETYKRIEASVGSDGTIYYRTP
jgi:soluble lytic murein transglycosylase-like protein